MKKSITGCHNYSTYLLFFLISVLIGRLDSLAQNTFQNTGTNVGIGTTNPSKRLHLANLGSNNGIQFDSKFRLRTSDVSNNHFVFENLTSNGSIYFRGGGALGKLILNDQGGNVGIGTTSPSEKLQIENGIVKIRNNNNTNRFIWSRTDNTMLAGLAGDGARKMFLIANNATRMTIDGNTGYVGIGTSSPTEKLDVNGKAKVDKAVIINGVDPGNPSAQEEQLRLSGYGILGNRGSMYITNENPEGTIYFNVGGKHGAGSHLLIKSDGFVGIGTGNSAGFKLAVNGAIRAKEIKVETDWSDFVFEKGYDLPTLEEVANHIAQKGHLKDIPSATEVEKNGVFLGEMDAKLLQKIEELTLYLLEQDKVIKEQNGINNKQAILIEKLEKRINILEKHQN